MLLWVEEHGAGDKLGLPFQESWTNGGSRELTDKGWVAPTIWSISNYLTSTRVVLCPSDQKRLPAATSFGSLTDGKISYLLCLEADFRKPETVLLADRHIGTNNVPLPRGKVTLWNTDPVHWTTNLHAGRGGNIAMADGSVHWVTNNDGLHERLSAAGPSQNTLVLP
jgi:prepilin-type processing-associated H-X9-DG protein